MKFKENMIKEVLSKWTCLYSISKSQGLFSLIKQSSAYKYWLSDPKRHKKAENSGLMDKDSWKFEIYNFDLYPNATPLILSLFVAELCAQK